MRSASVTASTSATTKKDTKCLVVGGVRHATQIRSASSIIEEALSSDQHQNNRIDWDDRKALQGTWENTEKGWEVEVEWNDTPYGIGLFAAQDIPQGTLLRSGRMGQNLMKFETVTQIEDFLRAHHVLPNSPLYHARLRYVADYLWGFYLKADNDGYPLKEEEEGDRHRFYGMWVPGNGLNHSHKPNTVYRTSPKGIGCGINLVALSDVRRGDELFDDYTRHGPAPEWLKEFAIAYKVNLNFADCNDFVGNK